MNEIVVLRSIAALRAWRAGERRAGRRVGLVPTMGALHAGHLSLVDAAHGEADSVVASIFVNPTQFAPHEDFSKYPRSFEADVGKLQAARCEAVFAPPVEEMYPAGFATSIQPEGPAKVGLEDRFRPTHFAGVATVVAKLLMQAQPEVAVFGEKDFQQLAVIRHVVRDLDMPVAILGAPTIREADGLALSSRNVYLSKEERDRAALMHRVLRDAATAARAGATIEVIEENAVRELSGHGFAVDYVAIRDAASLAGPAVMEKPETLRILAAAKLGATRLIDNIALI